MSLEPNEVAHDLYSFPHTVTVIKPKIKRWVVMSIYVYISPLRRRKQMSGSF